MNIIPWGASLVRLLVPFAILKWPLGGIFASILADMSDWKMVHVTSDSEDVIYQTWDKAMDLYSWIFILWIVRSWKDVWARRVAIGFFGYRLIGMIWFWLSGWRALLFFFPNVFENFVVLYLLLFRLTKKSKLELTFLQKTLMLIILILPKLFQEYFQHFLEKQPWEIYDIGNWLGLSGLAQELTNLFAWGGILYVIPMLGFLWYIVKSKKKTPSKIKKQSL